MSELASAFVNFLGALTQSFHFSSFLPAAIFVISNFVLLNTFFQDTDLYKSLQAANVGGLGALIALSLAISYSLNALNVPLTQLYEGYVFRRSWLGKILTLINLRRKHWLGQQIEKPTAVQKQAMVAANTNQGLWRKSAIQIKALYEELNTVQNGIENLSVRAEYFDEYPSHDLAVLPTKLGNIFASL
jgi:hypothetical protein